MIEAGTYNAKVVKQDDDGQQVACVFGESENKGTPFVGVEFRVDDGEFAGQRLSWRGHFTGNSTERVIESLLACGFEGDDINAYPQQSPDKTVKIVVEHEEYPKGSDEFRARIAWVNGARGVKKLDTTAKKTLGAALKTVIAAQRAGLKAEETAAANDNAKPEAASKTAGKKKAPF